MVTDAAGSAHEELRLADIFDMAAANEFLPKFMERFNEKFSLPLARAENLHRRLNVQASRLADILWHQELRHVSQQLSLACDRIPFSKLVRQRCSRSERI